MDKTISAKLEPEILARYLNLIGDNQTTPWQKQATKTKFWKHNIQ